MNKTGVVKGFIQTALLCQRRRYGDWMSTGGGGAMTLIGCSVFQLWWQRSAGFGGVGEGLGKWKDIDSSKILKVLQ